MAEISCHAPLLAFAGVDRCIVLLRGQGMWLRCEIGAIDVRLNTPINTQVFIVQLHALCRDASA